MNRPSKQWPWLALFVVLVLAALLILVSRKPDERIPKTAKHTREEFPNGRAHPASESTQKLPTESPDPPPDGQSAAIPESIEARVRRRQVLYDKWSTHAPQAVLRELVTMTHSRMPGVEVDIVGTALSQSLRSHGSERSGAAIQAIGDLVARPDTTPQLRALLIKALSQATTQAAATKLIQLASSGTMFSNGTSLQKLALSGISVLGAEWTALKGTEDLTPVLLPAAASPANSVAIRSAIVQALGDVGSQQAAEWMVTEIFRNNPTLQHLQTVDDPMVDALLGGLDRLRTKDAVNVLSKNFTGYDIDNPKLYVLGPALAGSAQEQGSDIILNWATKAPAEFAPAVHEWLRKTRNLRSYELIKRYLNESSFSRNEVRAAVVDALDLLTLKDVK